MIKFDKNNLKQWMRLGPRAMYGQFMLEIAKFTPNLMVISADLGRSSGLDRFKKQFPEKYMSVGISEQNMIGVAAGLAYEGYKVFVSSFAPFLSMRSSEHIRMNLGYMEHPVNLVALGSGVSMGFLGNSHFGLEDIAYMRSIPNMNLSSPADSAELGKTLIDYVENNRGPSYIRLTGIPGSRNVYSKDFKYTFGSGKILEKGKEILILASGSIVGQSLIAVRNLNQQGVFPELINIHTLNYAAKFITKILNRKKFKKLIVIEEHSIIGGLCSIVSEVIADNNTNIDLHKIALPNKYLKNGDYNYLLNYYGLNAEKIEKKIKKIINV